MMQIDLNLGNAEWGWRQSLVDWDPLPPGRELGQPEHLNSSIFTLQHIPVHSRWKQALSLH